MMVVSLGVRASLAGALFIGLPGIAAAQFPPPAPPANSSSSSVQDRWPDPPKPSPRGAAPTAGPSKRQAAPANTSAGDDASAPAKAAPSKPAAPRTPANVVACNGVFSKDSTHLKLAIKFDSRNVAFDDVDGPDGSKIKASVLYPGDPKRRLEVVWNNDAARTDVSVISINGKSQWTAPKGLKLGLPIAALQKLNGKPFKLGGFTADGSSSVTGWDGGALSSLPGGCKVGIRLSVDSKASPDARSAVSGDKELSSNDPNVLAAKPSVAEILIGY
ncbi:hypothetical protein [Rhodoplanes sp. Z2-YC6860]|uniref:hypothetical protein n=1 Tax=Rhodoplanes sp. Z2-YC6860 TaxID=674703 RepID=UPI00078C122C|nr:hypothetical protein [Rhodoplanes sp. Z2-YC6860]AMN40043.1 hypothetical protein RHPLAN_15880 [Rhodoplanes sp. Z2-YC6860]